MTAVVAYTDNCNRANSAWGAAGGDWVDAYSGAQIIDGKLAVKYCSSDPSNLYASASFIGRVLARPEAESSIYNKIEFDLITTSSNSQHSFLLRSNGTSFATLTGLHIVIRRFADQSLVNAGYWFGGSINNGLIGDTISGGLAANTWYKVTAEITGSNPATLNIDIKNSSGTSVYTRTQTYSQASFPEIQADGNVAIAMWTGAIAPQFDNITIWKDSNLVAPSAPSIVLHADPEIPANNPLLAIIENMPEQSWQKVNTNYLSTVWTPNNKSLSGGSDNQFALINAWSSFAWDTENGGIIIFGGGHANTGNNSVLIWDSTTLQWRAGSLPTQIVHRTDISAETYLTVDPDSPQASHCYDNNVFLPVSKRFMTFGGSCFNAMGTFKRLRNEIQVNTGPFFFDPAKADANKVGGVTGSGVNPNDLGSGAWQNRDMYYYLSGQSIPNNNFLAGTTDTYIENGKDVVLIQQSEGIFKYTINSVDTLTTDTIGKIAGPPYWGDQGCGAYNPYSKLYVKTGSPTFFSYWDLRDSLVGPNNPIHNFNPDVNNVGAYETIANVNATGIEFDSVRNQFFLSKGGDFVYTLREPRNADGWIFDIDNPEAIAGPGNGLANDTTDLNGGILGKWKKAKGKNGSPGFDVFVLLKAPAQGDVWIYKPKNWVNPNSYRTVDTITISIPSTPGTYPNNGYALYVASSEEGLVTAEVAATIGPDECIFTHARATGSAPNYYAVKGMDNEGTPLYSDFSNVVSYAFVITKQLHGYAETVAIASGELESYVSVAANALAQSTALGALSASVALFGSATAKNTAKATLGTFINLDSMVVSHAIASGVLDVRHEVFKFQGLTSINQILGYASSTGTAKQTLCEMVYLGDSNFIIWQLMLDNIGIDHTLLSRVRLVIDESQIIDSADSEIFDLSASNQISMQLGKADIPPGLHQAYLQVYDLNNNRYRWDVTIILIVHRNIT
jgi:hypothetical protein